MKLKKKNLITKIKKKPPKLTNQTRDLNHKTVITS
jgi:hypothetical protein